MLEKDIAENGLINDYRPFRFVKELTDTWQDHGVKAGNEYAILTNEISKAWSGMTTREYKDFKGLKTENLRG